jgi:hypothetical protein
MYQGLHFMLLQYSFIKRYQAAHVAKGILITDIELYFAGKLLIVAYLILFLKEFAYHVVLIIYIF